MELFFMSLTTGIMVGGIYALVALGWVLIYKCSGVLNLAMGELTLIGAYVTYSFYSTGMPFVLAVFLTLLVGIVLGFLTERIFLDKLIGEPILAVIMVTVGISFFLKGLIGYIWGSDTRVFQPAVFDIKPISLGILRISPVYLWSFILAIVLLIVFMCFFKYTRVASGCSGRSQFSARRHCGRDSDRFASEFFRHLSGSVFSRGCKGDRPLCFHGCFSSVQALWFMGLGAD